MKLVEFTNDDLFFTSYGDDPERWWLDRADIVPGPVGDLLRNDPDVAPCRFVLRDVPQPLSLFAFRIAVRAAHEQGLTVLNRLPRPGSRRPVACHRNGKWNRFDGVSAASRWLGTSPINVARYADFAGSGYGWDWFDYPDFDGGDELADLQP